MLFLLSPAKTLDYERPLPRGVRQRATDPQFLPQAAGLIDSLKSLATGQVAQLMSLSDDLAALNVARFGAWRSTHDNINSRPALLAFNGDVYEGLDARSLKGTDLGWAQDHLVILSGLYGALRPLDRLQPYRLEMGTGLANDRGSNLYAYWG
ncbi:MAG: YaaA family protein, partial [Microbacteriaceae bacterium]|nr:YaaA family protein [Burkholderiaceae bacterium]